jgi:hypothetical protein
MSQDILNNRNKLLTDFDKNNVGEKMLSFLKINLFEEERSIDRQ